MPKAKKTESLSVDPIDPAPTAELAKEMSKGLVDHIDIYKAEEFIRTYSLADHGENFADLADQYIAGHPNCHKQ